jgi:cytochrome c1
MQEQSSEYKKLIKKAERLAYTAIILLGLCIGLLLLKIYDPTLSIFQDKKEILAEVDEDLIENGIHIRTGFIDDVGLMTVVNNCTTCHSSKLVIQNRMNTDRWNATIKWMQKTQNLWELGPNQKIIVDYLVKNYPPIEKGRRASLTNINWYELKE